jgi:hypothetical protein
VLLSFGLCCPTGRYTLRVLCALLLATQATAATNGETRKDPTKRTANAKAERLSLSQRLERKLDVAQRQRTVIRFFAKHRWLLTSKKHRVKARAALRRANRRLTQATRNVVAIQQVLRRKRLARSPRAAICKVFGRRYCGQALSVAWCESRYSTTAQNGQYLGLFQMGWSERRLFGHGRSAIAQAKAAHRYFVLSGRDWSPWSCKPSYA